MLKRLMLFAAVFVLSAGFGSQCMAAGTDSLTDSIYIRENGTDHQVTFSVAAGEMVVYAKDDTTCTTHKTSANRHYGHVHITYSLPKTGTVVGQSQISKQVTNAKIKAYFDNAYGSDYTSSGSEDIAQNCHGYAFGISTWIQDTAYIDEDDYESASGWSDAEVLRGEGDTHRIKVESFDASTYPDTVKTSEKMRTSRIYKATWKWSNPDGSDDKRKKKAAP